MPAWLLRRDLDVTDIHSAPNVGTVEFTTRTVATQVVPACSGYVVASTPDGLCGADPLVGSAGRRHQRNDAF